MKIHQAILVALLCHLNTFHFGHCFQPDVASFGDFMELLLSVPVACSNVAQVKNTTNLILKNFADCTKKVTASSSEAFESLELICQNQDTYLNCWNKLKDDIEEKCQKNHPLPAVYAATVKSLCNNDLGNITISNLREASKTITEADQENCPEETGTHWLDNCKPFLETMISDNLCERHDAIDNCLGKITCTNFEFGRLHKQIYTGGRVHLNCDTSD